MADYEEVLSEARFTTAKSSPYPYYIVQINDKEELELKGNLVSDAIAAYIKENPVTHVFLQTHGWNTPPDKAVAVPFSEFISGMQDDASMPKPESGFKPIFIAFIWPALPIQFMKEDDARTRAELLKQSESELQTNDRALEDVINAAETAANEDQAPSEDLKNKCAKLVQESDTADSANEAPEAAVERAMVAAEEPAHHETEDRGIRNIIKNIFNPVQNFLFGRLMDRGRRTGKVMQSIIAKFMHALPDPSVKYCLMANSLGAHVLGGALEDPVQMPRKVHTVFFVQGAVACKDFEENGKYASVRNNVAGPIVCTHSLRDLMLLNVFGTFHGDALGIKGYPHGHRIEMKPKSEIRSIGYDMKNGWWNSVDGTEYIDEGNPIAGGHGDFKEDETTMTYWAAINQDVSSEYYFYGSQNQGGSEQSASAEEPENKNVFESLMGIFTR